MYGYIYMFTNRINNKKYIGQHIGEIDENYFGSGVIFAKAKEKYGIENFKFDILCFCKTKEELDNAERHFIGFEYYTFVNTGRGYNIASGGEGGNVFIGKTDEEMKIIKEKMSGAMKGKNPWANKTDEEMKIIGRKISEANSGENNPMYGKGDRVSGKRNPMYGRTGEKHPFYGKHHTEETKKKISEAHKGLFAGENHPRAKKVICIETGEIFNCIEYAAKWCGLKSHMSIIRQIQGKSKSAGGYHWKYID